MYDNIAFGLRIAKVKEDEIDERVTEMLEIVSLKGFENRKVTSLSGGQQRVWPLPAHWSTARCCCSTSLWAHSICACARICRTN